MIKQAFRTAYAAVIISLVLTGCIRDDRNNCPQGIDVRLYSRTPCDTETFYPAQVQDLRFYVFDMQGRLVSVAQDNHVQLNSDYVYTIPASNGLFTVIAWSGLEAGTFDMVLPAEGTITRNDLLFRLKSTAAQAFSLNGKKVYYGESSAVYLPDPDEYGSVFQSTTINLREITNRITVEVEGLPDAGDYEVAIESMNASMIYEGNNVKSDLIEYPSETTVDAGVLQSSFTLLKLATGLSTTLIVREKHSGTELYRGDLLGTLLLKNPGVNLDCDHDFNIRFTISDQCNCGTYTIMEIWVNNWLVHSYNTDL